MMFSLVWMLKGRKQSNAWPTIEARNAAEQRIVTQGGIILERKARPVAFWL